MRTLTKLTLLALAAAGIRWWLRERRRRGFDAGFESGFDSGFDSIDDVATGTFRAPSGLATVGLTDGAYDSVADAVERADIEFVADIDEDSVEPSVEEREEGYVGAEAGESWFEAVEQDAIEGGQAPEAELRIEAEADEPLHSPR
jgi:hypothetical protein